MIRLDLVLPDLRPWRYRMRTLFWGPFITGMFIVVILAVIPQSREVYLGIIDGQEYFRGLLGLALVMGLCGLLHCWQHMLGSAAIERLYPEHGDIRVDRGLLQLRDWLSRVSAFLPLIGLGVGLIKLFRDTSATADAVSTITSAEQQLIRGETGIEQGITTARLPFYVAGTAIVAALILIVFISFARSRVSQRRLKRYSLRKIIMWSGAVLSAAAVILPLMFPGYVVPVARAMGPLAMTAIVLIAFVSVFMGLSFLSNLFRLPVTGAIVMAFLVLAGWQISAALSPRAVEVAARTVNLAAAHEPQQLEVKFGDWLRARQSADLKKFKDYPVFIVATQGGGIYAASAATAFLSAMQDNCPGFAQHVFAISGVSGGAVGAALFTAALQNDKGLERYIGCPRLATGATNSLSEFTKEVVRQDHLSPALALMLPDIARGPVRDVGFFSSWLKSWFDRSRILELSFACAFDRQDAWQPCLSSSGPGLRVPFAEHWNPAERAPALVLTSTWVETGFRAAYAPFPLHAVSDGTLFSFDGANGMGDFQAQGAPIDPVAYGRSVIQAAFVSARFPGIVPPWQVMTNPAAGQPRLWNFVDGGYVDNSGATTALELYKALDQYVVAQKLPVSLHLVLLTGSDTNPDFSEIADGTRFSDTIAPFAALLSVRGQLAGRAVTRAIDKLEPAATPAQLAGRCGRSKVLVVNLKQKTFEYTLGWKISAPSDKNVRLLLGDANHCNEPARKKPAGQDFDAMRVIRDNSCVKKRLEDLLSDVPVPEAVASAPGRDCPAAQAPHKLETP